jgi:hypothetical protein
MLDIDRFYDIANDKFINTGNCPGSVSLQGVGIKSYGANTISGG